MWRDQSGMMEMLLAYIGEYEESRDWTSWRNVLIDILSFHETYRRNDREYGRSLEKQVETEIKSEDLEDVAIIESPETHNIVDTQSMAIENIDGKPSQALDSLNHLHRSDLDQSHGYPQSTYTIESDNSEFIPGRMQTSSFSSSLSEQSTMESWNTHSSETASHLPRPENEVVVRDVEVNNRTLKIRMLKCRFCEEEFSMRSECAKHERTHTGGRPFSCIYCKKTFPSNCSRIRHERIHTGEKPFACNYCSSCFKTRFEKQQHERTHTGETPFPCRYCDKKFRFLTSRKTHERTHFRRLE